MPDQACRTACSTRASQLWPAWTTTATPPQESSALTVNPSEAIFSTVPGNPSSDTSRLEPPPMISSGSPAASADRTASMISASVRASMKRAGGAADGGRGQGGKQSLGHLTSLAGYPPRLP